MGFAFDHADASQDVVDMLKASLCEEGGLPEEKSAEVPPSLPLRLARLHLLSDILYNSSAAVRNASTYRTYLQLVLPYVFAAFHSFLAALGRITKQYVEEKLIHVLKVWEGWSIYPPLFLVGLEATLIVDLEGEGEEGEGGNEEEELEKERDALIRQARQAGLVTEGSLGCVVRRMKRLDEYIKRKAAGGERGEEGGGGGRGRSRWEGGGGGGGGEEDMSRYGPAAAAAPLLAPTVTVTAAASASVAAAAPYTSMRPPQKNEDEDEDEDDVDGTPMDEAATSIFSSMYGLGRRGSDDEEEDEDVDGRPVDLPLSSSSSTTTITAAAAAAAAARKKQGR
eukprot:evm.model.NODE_27172_length_5403_cov_13.087729.1